MLSPAIASSPSHSARRCGRSKPITVIVRRGDLFLEGTSLLGRSHVREKRPVQQASMHEQTHSLVTTGRRQAYLRSPLPSPLLGAIFLPGVTASGGNSSATAAPDPPPPLPLVAAAV